MILLPIEFEKAISPLKAAVLEAGNSVSLNPKINKLELKAGNVNLDYVTKADILSEKVMAQILRAHYQDIWIIGEETGADHNSNYGLVARLDGIDGTEWFGRGVQGLWSIVATLEQDGQVIATALHFPPTHELIVAHKDYGVAIQNTLTHQWNILPPRDELITVTLGKAKIVTWRGDSPDGYNPYSEAPLKDLISQNSTFFSFLSSSFTIKSWALGMFDGLMIPYQACHDLAPMRLIIPLLGGEFSFYESKAGWNSPPITSSAGITDPKRTFHTIGAINHAFFDELEQLCISN